MLYYTRLFMSMAMEKSSGKYLWATEIWHRRLLIYDEKPGRLSQMFFGRGGSSQTDDAWSTADTISESLLDDRSDRSGEVEYVNED
jgi:uncharacterized membrane protein